MSDTFSQFEKRLDSLERKHRELSKGYVAKINPDGLITVAPKPSKRTGLTVRVIVLIAVGFITFKALALAIIGFPIYETRLEGLAEGSMIEQTIAWVMQIDPVSQSIASFVLTAF